MSRTGLENLLATREVAIAGSIGSVELLVEQISDSDAEVVLIEAGNVDHELLLESLSRSDLVSEIAIVILADHAPSEWIAGALRAGIRAVLPRDISRDRLIAALQAAASGLFVLDSAETDTILRSATAAANPPEELAEPLTRREREVLQMLAAGIGNKEIAARLSISEHTVKFHVTSILGKMGASSRTEAVSIGIRRGLVLL
jgi:DNA-binding NarL/FixJ family response regulator